MRKFKEIDGWMNETKTEQKMSASLEITPIGIIHSCYTEKFGIPRQPGLADKARATIELFGPYGRREMLKELERFSHIWVHFVFHAAIPEGWRPTVRPPGLGGQKRVGVFASRSPHRPNHLGISVVKLIYIDDIDGRVFLEVGGGDFLNESPVLDIKPYIPYSDSVPGALSGYTDLPAERRIHVSLNEEAEKFCEQYEQKTGRDLSGLIEQVLSQDPRPASQRHAKKTFGFCLWDVNIRWIVQLGSFVVVECRSIENSAAFK
ncbi:MAG: tRNA (N6-threonylcarbamoyladenosine(37)-N6)-methyltransferase TrmO [Desulfopila sp.]|nr:tRNA (N6-threonylcarbamoyladenosine(37)-N6)-methyltransferase TrmO [Desulfopila sp.]